MTTPRHIDISALKTKFRAAAAARGIDPLEGSTGYQVALLRAEQSQRVQEDPHWWQAQELWVHEPPYASIVEEAALEEIRIQAYLATLTKVNVALKRKAESPIPPLRDRLADRGERLVWVDLGDGRTSSVIRPLTADTCIPIAETATFADLDERAQRAVSMRLSGDSYSLIATALKVDKSEVIRWIKKYRAANADAGIPLYEPPQHRHSHETRCAALEMYQAGMSANSIGRQLGIQSKTVWSWVHSR